MSDFSSILVTGGAGYIGSVLTRKLLSYGYNVKVIDSLIFGNDGIADLIYNNSIKFINNDLRNEKILPEIVKDIDCVIHLAAIVGEPLCKKIPKAAKQINELATKKLVSIAKNCGVKRFIFASTCSNYGSSDIIVNEETPLQSLSLYSETKVNCEHFILDSKDANFEPCVLRFATAHGLSPRMRFDLLLHEFLRDAVIDNKISIFGPNFWRPLIHVEDIADACISSITNAKELISGQIYNVGDNSENYTKIELAKIIQKFLPLTEIKIIESKVDPRNYKVSFNKIKNDLKFAAKKSVQISISEILKEIQSGMLDPRKSEFSNLSKLTEKVNVF